MFVHSSIMADQQKQEEIRKLETSLNLYKQEREVLQNECERKRRILLDQLRTSTGTQTNVIRIDIAQLNNEYGRTKQAIESKIYETRLSYFKKLQE